MSKSTAGRSRRATTPSEEIRVIEHENVFRGRLLSVHVDRIASSNGTTRSREIVSHPGAVAIVPVLPNSEVLLVRQYRHAVRSDLWEIPAGKIEPGEDPLACAQRELLEETGYAATDWTSLCTFYTSPGFSNERITLFVAGDLRRVESPSGDEIADRRALPIAEVKRRILASEITDAKTVLAITWLLALGREVG